VSGLCGLTAEGFARFSTIAGIDVRINCRRRQPRLPGGHPAGARTIGRGRHSEGSLSSTFLIIFFFFLLLILIFIFFF